MRKFKKLKQLLSCNMLIISALIILLALLIFCPKVTFSSAKNGLVLWADSVLPGIFPAMIITSCILSLCPMTPSTRYMYVAICGLLGGYPLGAVLCKKLCAENGCCSNDGTINHCSSGNNGRACFISNNLKISNLIMAYCNISSPSFVLNYILRMNCFKNVSTSKMLFCIYAPSILALAVIFFVNRKAIGLSGPDNSKRSGSTNNLTNSQNTNINFSEHSKPSFTDVLDTSIWQAINNSLKLGGYIVLFACISGFVVNFPYFEPVVKAVTCGILEITNGISLIDFLDISSQFKILAILAVNSFGGISTIMQTIGMIKGSDLSIKKYIYHKLLLCGLTVIIALPVIYVL